MSAARGLAATIAILTAVSVAGIWLPGWAYLPVNLTVMVVLISVARTAGATHSETGTRRAALRRGLLVGAATLSRSSRGARPAVRGTPQSEGGKSGSWRSATARARWVRVEKAMSIPSATVTPARSASSFMMARWWIV